MLNFIIAFLAGLVCGVLSGFGIGGGSLLMVWMTAVQSLAQQAAQGMNIIMPQRTYEKDGKKLYADVFHPITGGARAMLKEAVIDAYKKAKK